MRITPRTLVTSAVTGMLAIGLASSPAQAFTKAEKRAEKRQNSTIKKTTRSVSQLNASRRKTNATIKTLAATLGTTAGSAKKSADTLAAALPVVTTALTQLRDGLTAAGAGLTQLKTGLETAGAGLTRLGDAYGSVEYGVGKVFIGGAGNTPTTGTSLVSSDVPDDGNAITVSGTTAFIHGAANETTPIDLRAIIRSAEADGVAGAGPVGQVGGSLYVKQLSGAAAGALIPCGAPYGASQGFAGTPTGASIVTPAGPVTNLNLVNIAEGSSRTDTTGPTATSTSVLPASCGVPTEAGVLYEIVWSVNFVDVPTSTTPGPKD